MLMYCVAAYPAKYVNLFVIDELKKITPDVGFSDHTVDFLYTPMSAVKNHGAVAIEKHFSCVAKDTPDAFHSLDPREFATMVDYVQGKKSSKLGPLESERDMLLKHKRRLVATREIKDGERLVLNENYGVYRVIYSDTSALSPHMAKEVNGLQVRMRLEPGQPVTPLHVNV
jgi:sialic acid synthase SpsE